MTEDKLSTEQRIRLESVAQANAFLALQRLTPATTDRGIDGSVLLTAVARHIELYIRDGHD